MLQGFGYIGWISIPYIREALFGAAILLAGGICVMVAGLFYAPQSTLLTKK
jgi:hypothetical protein